MQGVTRNPLADPGLLGVNARASFSVVVAIWAFDVTGAPRLKFECRNMVPAQRGLGSVAHGRGAIAHERADLVLEVVNRAERCQGRDGGGAARRVAILEHRTHRRDGSRKGRMACSV